MTVQHRVSRWRLPRGWPEEFENAHKPIDPHFLVTRRKHALLRADPDPLDSFLEGYSTNFGRPSIAADVIRAFCAGVDWKSLEGTALDEQPRTAWICDQRPSIHDPAATSARETSGTVSSSDLLKWLNKQVS
jgi:hypothetical protein